MNDILKNKLERLAEDDLMMQAIRIIFDEQIDNHQPKINQVDEDSVIGQKYRAYRQAKGILNDAMLSISSYKTTTSNPKGFNKAR